MMDNQVATMDNQEEPLQRFAVHADDVRESFKLAFESVKHLTTLSAASLALFATFLDTIFPKELDFEIKVLISLSFAAFILSLVLSAISMWRIAGLVRSRRGYEKKKRRIRWNILLPSMSYILGLSFLEPLYCSTSSSEQKILEQRPMVGITFMERWCLRYVRLQCGLATAFAEETDATQRENTRLCIPVSAITTSL
jgi:hypothetical protein